MSSPIQADPYQTLGVPKDADLSTIRTAHRKLVLKYHPDRIKDPGDRERGKDVFQKVQQSYELLSDDHRRNRYDQEVRLAELRKEQVMKEPIRSASYPSRTTAGSSNDYRDGHRVEERAPRIFDDDRPYFDEPRPSAKKYDKYDRYDRYDRYDKSDRYDKYEREPYREKERERKTSTTYSEKKSSKNASGLSATIEKKLRQSAKATRERVLDTKSRDKERKREASDKHSSRSVYVEDGDDSSDSDTIVPPSRKPPPPKRAATYDERPRSSKAETPRKREERRTARDEDYSDEWDTYRPKHEEYHSNARDYIERSRSGTKVYQTDDAHYWSRKEADRISGRKGGGDREGRKSGSDRDDRRDERSKPSKSRRPSVEYVEPPPRIIPSMPKHTSAPSNLKVPSDHRGAPMPQRSATAQVGREYRREMPLPRSNTTPLAGMTSRKTDSIPSKGSKLKHTETHDSGYGSSSPNTPEHYGVSPPKSSKHTIVDEDEDYSRSARIIPVDPEDVGVREMSPPPRERERPTRPTLSTKGTHAKATRTTTYTYPSAEKRPNPTRQSSSRPSTSRENPGISRGESAHQQKLYGEDGHGSVYPNEKVSFSPHHRMEDVNFAPYRRPSADQRDRDYFDPRPPVHV